jgi:hypothetical protein
LIDHAQISRVPGIWGFQSLEAFTLIHDHLGNVGSSCAFKKGASLIEIKRANPLSRLLFNFT